MRPFLTAYDPLGGSSGSIDPLGSLQTYGALAEMLLPGVTTITNRSRYLSMLCRALSNAEKYQRFPPGAAGLHERRRAVEPFERLWALACVAAENEGEQGAADGLRGITYAKKALQRFDSQRRRFTPEYRLLKYQGRTGAVGTYWTLLVGGELVDGHSGRLMPEGRELGEQFPQPKISDRALARLASPGDAHDVGLTRDELVDWGKQCHLAAATGEERRKLREALTADDRRECVAQALKALSRRRLPEEWDVPWVEQLRSEFARNERARRIGLPVVADAIVRCEQFHEAALAVFESMLWWATVHAEVPADHLAERPEFATAARRTRETASELLEFQSNCTEQRIRRALDSLATFANVVVRCQSSREVMDECLQRHRRVQSGKLDGGVPKRNWVDYQSGAGRLLRPSPRFQRMEEPPGPTGTRLTHPYRLEQFVFMLTENGALPIE